MLLLATDSLTAYLQVQQSEYLMSHRSAHFYKCTAIARNCFFISLRAKGVLSTSDIFDCLSCEEAKILLRQLGEALERNEEMEK